MTEPIISPELYSRPRLSRREVLKILIAIPAGYAIGTGIGKLLTEPVEPQSKEDEIKSFELLANEQTKLLDEIVEYRKSLGLHQIPAHLTYSKLEQASLILWNRDVKDVDINISEAHKSHAQQALRIQKLLFGGNAKRLVRQIESDPGLTTAGTFNNNTRIMSLDTLDDPTSPWFTFVSTHENTHAADPTLITSSSIYPLDTLIKVSHGMARVLNQSMKIEGMFLNNPDSYNIPFIKKEIGQGVGTLFLQDQSLMGQVDFAGHNFIVATLASIAKEQGVNIKDIKFTKKTCLRLGGALLPKILNESIVISGSLLNDWYSPKIEGASREIFADMVATALMAPEKINHNQEILTGITEILSGIQGKSIKLSEIIDALHFMDNEIKDRFMAEQEAVMASEQLLSSPEASSLSEGDVQAIQGEAILEEQKQDAIWNFIIAGQVPPDIGKDSVDIRSTMEKYGQVVKTVYDQYPEIIYGLNADDVSFDPDLHVWDTWKVAEAWNVNVFCNLLADPSLIPENLKDVKRRIGVLENFINSPEFNRPLEQSALPRPVPSPTHADALRERMKTLLA